MSSKKDSNPDIETVLEGDTGEAEGSDSFFDSLEKQVNGQVSSDETNDLQPETEQVTQQQTDPEVTGNDEVDLKAEVKNLKKRYSDSSREAQRLKSELSGVEGITQYKPLIDYLQNNPDSVQALRNHINGKPEDKFSEDFVFDGHEAITEPNSESAKALKQMIDSEADKRVQSRMAAQANKNRATITEMKRQREVDDFIKRTGINQEELNTMQEWASRRELTMDDIYYLMNKEKVADNVANNTKQDMLNQMKAVRNIPMSASNANSAPDQRSPDDAVFDILKGMDEGAENLFG